MGLFRKTVLIMLLTVPTSAWAQINKPSQIDEFGRVNSEEIEARLDNATIQLLNNPDSLLQFVFSRGKKDTLGSVYRLYGLMKTYLLVRKIDMKRVAVSFCEPKDQQSGQIWLVSETGPRKSCDPENITIAETTMFDLAPSATMKGIDFGCCIVDSFGPVAAGESLRGFAELLKRYPRAKGYVFSYGGTNKYLTSDSRGRNRVIRNLDTARDVAAMSRKARRILTQAGVDRNRIITKNAGYRDWGAQMEFWIVPHGGVVPKPSPNYPKKRSRK